MPSQVSALFVTAAGRIARRALLSLAVASAALSQLACSSGLSALNPYKIDIQQGNVVTRERADLLKPGLQRAQVRDLLGSPLLTSVFHADRWDYVFTFRRQGQPLLERKLTVFFKGDLVDHVQADELPTEAEFVASLDKHGRSDRQPVLEATEQQLRDFQARNAPAPEPDAPAATGTAPVVYPPLESTGGAR